MKAVALFKLCSTRFKTWNGFSSMPKRSSNVFTTLIDSSSTEVDKKDFSIHEVPKVARVVICGGGIIGCSVAYHLAKNHGWTDIVLIEQSRIASRSVNKYGAGLLGQLKPTTPESKLCKKSIDLIKTFTESGLRTGWKQCGSLLLARNKDRMVYFKHLSSSADARNIESHILTPKEAQEKCPIISTDLLEGALWIPGDGVGDPYFTVCTLVNETLKHEVTFVEDCAVQKVITDEFHRVKGVETRKGIISCEYFVNCAGYWGKNVGRLSHPRVKVPLYACEHHYLHTLQVPDIDPNMPVIRDYDGHFYIRENNGCYLAGGFEPISKPLELKEFESLPKYYQPLQEDWDQFHVLLRQMLFRIPSLGKVEVDALCNGPECFSPDARLIVGEAPEVRNYFVVNGMKAIGFEAFGGCGEVIADWIVNGEPQINLIDLDIRRFLGLHNNSLFLRDRMTEVPGVHYRLKYPHLEFETGRCIRMSPIYPRLKAAGAVFRQSMGYERPCYFKTEKNVDYSETPAVHDPLTFYKPKWFDNLQSEYDAFRTRVALLDYSSFTKLEVWSPGKEALNILQYLCSNNIDIPLNTIVHTGMQNKYGGYENDCSVVRMEENRFMIIAPATQQTRCLAWIKRNLPTDSPVVATDITSLYTSICLMGPLAQIVMSELTDTSVSYKDFPFFTYKELNLGLATGIKTFHQTHTGELGYVLYIPNEFALHCYDELMKVGAKYGIQHVGHYAPKHLRAEKFFAFWGQDLDTITTPFESGRVYRVDLNKEFLGKEALLKQKQEGVKRKFVQLLLEDHDEEVDVWPWGSEPIYCNDKIVGLTTTAAYGFTLQKQVCLGFVRNLNEKGEPQIITNDYLLKNHFEVDICGKRFPAKLNIHSPTLPPAHDYIIDSNGYIATQG